MIKNSCSLAGLALLLVPVFLQSQVPQEGESSYWSLNREFTVQVKGLVYEGFQGPQALVFKNKAGKLLWKKTADIWSPPAVSNQGIVALLHSRVDFYDKHGSLSGSFSFQTLGERFWYYGEGSPPQRFSHDGKNYYTIISTKPSGDPPDFLVCLTTAGTEQWRFPLRRDSLYRIDAIYEIHTFNGGIIAASTIQGYTFHTACYLIDESGQLITEYHSDSRPRYFVSVRDSIGTFAIRQGDTLSTYTLPTGRMLTHEFAPVKRKRATAK